MKKLFSILLALILTACFCITAFAHTGTLIGSAKTIIYLDEWTLGAEYEEPWEISAYIGNAEDVTVIDEYGVIHLSTLGDHAFANNSVTKTVRFPNSIEKIGEYAFLNATALETVVLGAGVRIVGIGAFSGTESLRTMNLEDSSVERIPTYLFLNSGIEEIALPTTCTSISGGAFVGCHNLAKITIPDNVTQIGDNAFSGCENLVIYTPYGSYAAQYAQANGIPYEYTDLTKVTFLRGDADGDGSVIIMDATKIQRVLAKFEDDIDGMIELRATLSDEGFGIMDATRIQRWLAQYDDPYRIGESETVWLTPDGTVLNISPDPAAS